jgi:hypothetical protein
MKTRRILLSAALVVLAALARSSSPVRAQAQNQPGFPTLARVQVLNADRSEAMPVKVVNSGDVLPVSVVGAPTVALLPTAMIGVKVSRQGWEYRQVVVAASEDATLALNQAGNDGWEAIAVGAGPRGAVWTLKRPR